MIDELRDHMGYQIHVQCRVGCLGLFYFDFKFCLAIFHHGPPGVSASLMASSSENASDRYHLPTEVCPRHYDLTIRTDLEKEKFTGFAKIVCV